nr:integral membrane protein GPR180 isoform X2 [Danio rerio]|eukprot:XP_021333013.1 integral membrane protein GPR180 isoform X2 [Danio rerio]
MMFVYSVFLSVLVFSSRHAAGKTVSGVFSSDAARGNNGQYITRFLYHGENGLMACRVDDALMALQKEAKLLLFQGSQAFDNLSCLERLTSAHISISLSRVEQNQTMPHESRPQTWHVMYADRYTCQDMQISNTLADIPFQITMMNPDSAGNPLDHFSAEEAGLHSFFFLLMVSYFVASCIYAQPLWQTLSKGGPMNSVLKVLSAALLLQGSSVLLNYIHMARYARDGVGTPLTRSLAERGAAGLAAAGGRGAAQFLTHSAQCVQLDADAAAGAARSVSGLAALSEHLSGAERAQTRLLHQLHQGLFAVVSVSPGAASVLYTPQ